MNRHKQIGTHVDGHAAAETRKTIHPWQRAGSAAYVPVADRHSRSNRHALTHHMNLVTETDTNKTIRSVDLIHRMYSTNQNRKSQIASADPKPDPIRRSTTPLRRSSERKTKQEGSDTTVEFRVGYASTNQKFLPRISREPLQVIDHGARITSRRAVQRKTVDVARRCRVVALLLLIAIPRTAPRRSHERFVQAPQV